MKGSAESANTFTVATVRHVNRRRADKQVVKSPATADRCPPEDTADEFLLGRLPHREAAEFALHLETCKRCAEEVASTRAIVKLLRDAARSLTA